MNLESVLSQNSYVKKKGTLSIKCDKVCESCLISCMKIIN